MIYFFALVFLVGTKSKNSKVRIDVWIFKRIEFLSPKLITTFSAVWLQDPQLITDPRLIARENPGVYMETSGVITKTMRLALKPPINLFLPKLIQKKTNSFNFLTYYFYFSVERWYAINFIFNTIEFNKGMFIVDENLF